MISEAKKVLANFLDVDKDSIKYDSESSNEREIYLIESGKFGEEFRLVRWEDRFWFAQEIINQYRSALLRRLSEEERDKINSDKDLIELEGPMKIIDPIGDETAVEKLNGKRDIIYFMH